MKNTDPLKKPAKAGPFLITLMFAILWGLLVFLLLPHPKRTTYLKEVSQSIAGGIGLNEVMKMGRQDLEHEELVSKIRKDLEIPRGLEVKILVGPFNNIVNEGQLFFPTNPFALVLLLNEEFYQYLTSEEKIALISHELGHLTNEIILLSYSSDTSIQSQIEADTYATKYTNPKAMMSLLKKASVRYGGFPSRQYYLRMQNLERIRRSQQGH